MKYRVLTKEELIPLEKDLVAFLIVNGIDGSMWEKINQEDPEKAIELVGLFSDVVLQKVYEKIQFLEFRSEKSCLVFNCGVAAIELISMTTDPNNSCDLSTAASIHEALVKHSNEIKIFKTEKAYVQERELEIHQLIESGCLISSEEFWISLEAVIS